MALSNAVPSDTNLSSSPRKVYVDFGGEHVITNEDDWKREADRLVAKYGPGVPKVRFASDGEEIASAATEPAVPVVSLVVAPQAVSSVPVSRAAAAVDAEGAQRSLTNLAYARAAGLAPEMPLYERGTRVIQLGVENARRSRSEHDALPLTGEAMSGLIDQIAGEQRRDVLVQMGSVRMNPENGRLAVGLAKRAGTDEAWSSRKGTLAVSERVLGRLTGALGLPGGGSYLAECWPALRAHNVNEWTSRIEREDAVRLHEAEDQATLAKDAASARAIVEAVEPRIGRFRVRGPSENPELFGVTGARYQPFDLDKIAKAIALASPKDARSVVKYDGFRGQVEVLWHSDVQPEKYVAGEFFKAGVTMRTDDTGGGGIQVSLAVFQNLCLNLIIIDRSENRIASIRHVGSVEALAAKFRKAFAKALSGLEPFRRAWNYSVQENVVEAVQAQYEETRGLSVEEVFPGIFNAIVERELVPVRGRREDIVKGLMRSWESDKSAAAGPTRAAVVNAFTHFSHSENQDPWQEAEIERAAGSLLFGRKDGSKPMPLPWLPLPKKS